MEKEEGRKERDKILREIVKQWNTVVLSILKAAKAWKVYCKIRLENNVNLEEFPEECQKTLMLANPKGDLDFILEDMIIRGRHFEEYLKTQIINIK